MKQERIKEFEEVSFLSEYKRRVKVERRFWAESKQELDWEILHR
jgi:hypothetical protein